MPLILNYKGSHILFYFSIDIHHEMHLYYIPIYIADKPVISSALLLSIDVNAAACVVAIYIIL